LLPNIKEQNLLLPNIKEQNLKLTVKF